LFVWDSWLGATPPFAATAPLLAFPSIFSQSPKQPLEFFLISTQNTYYIVSYELVILVVNLLLYLDG